MSGLDSLVTISLDKKRHLRLTLRGMIEFEKFTGKNILGGLALNDLSLEDIAALIWACLIHEDIELTCNDVIEMIDIGNLQLILEAVTNCISQSLPKAEAGDPLAEMPPNG